MQQNKPFASSCDRNQQPILEVLQKLCHRFQRILEVGSGTGQHAVFFASALPHLEWVTSDLLDKHIGIQLWIEEAKLKNITGPLEIDASKNWPKDINPDAVFTANTLHIMSQADAFHMIEKSASILQTSGQLIVYGPFKYQNAFTSPSNAKFDLWLKDQNKCSGIRDFESLNRAASQVGLKFIKDYSMPANNQLLVWEKA